MRAEQRRLDEYALTHGPTIGDTYEGLSRKVVGATLPQGPELSVVTGFITDGMGGLSRQIDCMLVSGEGEAIPHTQSFKWHVRDVIAVLSIFGGNFTFKAANRMNAGIDAWVGNSGRAYHQVLDEPGLCTVITGLVDESMVIVEPRGDSTSQWSS